MRFRTVAGILMLAFFTASGLMSAEAVFDFASGAIELNTSIGADRRGVKPQSAVDGLDGLLVHYDAWQAGNATWPYVASGKGALTQTDWSKYKFLKVRLGNPGPVIPRFIVTVRDRQGKYASHNLTLAAKSNRIYDIPLKNFNAVDLKNIAKIDFALSKPETPADVVLSTVTLGNTPEPATVRPAALADQNRLVGRIGDLRPEILNPKSGFQKYGTAKISGTLENLLVSYDDFKSGQASPNMVLTAAEDGSFNYGDFGYMTHFVYEVEGVEGFGGYLGMTFTDAENKTLWHSIGTPGTDFPIAGEQQFFENNLLLDKLKSLNISCGNAISKHTYRIKKLQFEFRPEALLQMARTKLDLVARQHLNAAEKSELDALRKKLADAYEPVRGTQFKYRDAMAFNACVSDVKKSALALLRRYNDRVLPSQTAQTYGVGIADSMTAVFLTGPGSEIMPAKQLELELAGNEYESFQVVVAAGRQALKNVKVELSPLTDAAGNQLAAECAVVGHALVHKQVYPQEHVGFYPDFIISYQQQCEVPAGETVPFWVRLYAPKNARPGAYRGEVQVSVDGAKPYRFPVTATVYGFTLPDGSALPTAWHVNDWQFSRFYKLADSPRKRELEYKFIDQNCRYRIMYDQIYWGPTVKDYRRDYYEKIKYVNDKYGIQQFTLFTLQLPNRWIMDPKDPKIDADINNMLAALDKWVPVCKEFGIWDKAVVYGFDEGKMDAVTQRYYDAIKAKCPELKISTTARYGDPALPAVEKLDIWVPIAKRFVGRPDLVKANRDAGKQVWWYVCDFPRPPEPTFMLDVPGAVPRIFMGWMTARFRPDGFLYWANIYWRNSSGEEKYRPIGEGPRTDWETQGCHPGDTEEGTLFCPGRDYTVLPTIRVENYRDGVEDYWYWTLLEKAMKSASPELKKRAEQALNIGPDLVAGSSEYTVDPIKIRAKRHEIATCLEAIGQSGRR